MQGNRYATSNTGSMDTALTNGNIDSTIIVATNIATTISDTPTFSGNFITSLFTFISTSLCDKPAIVAQS